MLQIYFYNFGVPGLGTPVLSATILQTNIDKASSRQSESGEFVFQVLFKS